MGDVDPSAMDTKAHSRTPSNESLTPKNENVSSAAQEAAVTRLQSSTTDTAKEKPAPGSTSTTPASEPQLTPLSPLSADRVFPIRSMIAAAPPDSYRSLNTPADEYAGFRIGPDSSIAARRNMANNSPPHAAFGETADSDTQGAGSSRQSSKNRSDTTAMRTRQGSLGDRRSSAHSNPHSRSDRISSSGLGGDVFGDSESDTKSRSSSPEDGRSFKSRASSTRSDLRSVKNENPANLVTARFKHVVTEEGHAIITGRDGDTLQRCEDEPIHIPGAIQSFGLLIALREEEDKLVVRIVSENSKSIIGYSPKQLFELESFLDILSEEQGDNLLDHLDFIRDEEANVEVNGPEVFLLSLKGPQRRTVKLWCAMHIVPANDNIIICEFELEDDKQNPLVPADEETPEPPEDTLGSEPTPEEFAESTINMSRPLRVLRSARKKKGEAAAMEVFNIMSQVQEQLANAADLEAFLKVLIGVIKELTGFHRVMAYQFDQSWNGRVVAELVDPRATKDLYNGLHFPASDIPQQARDMYRVNKVRLLYDREQQTSRLVCRSLQDMETPLDMTYAYLRAMSPIHVKYLRNMAVRASMSVSITVFGELWGLISCHAYGYKGMRVSFPIRKMCRLVGDTASRNIERLSYASRLQARKLINTSPTEANPAGYIVASSEDLLKLFNADCGALSIRDETKLLGKISQTQEILALLEYLRMKDYRSVFTSLDIAKDLPDLQYAPGFSVIAGMLYVPLSATGGDFIVFFRKGQLREVKWAGNPYEKFLKEGTEGYLEPRKSFKIWRETVVGRCREWAEEEIETGSVLSLVYGKFIEVWRQKETAMQNTQLTKLLLANSAHEVRTPLNAIINYLEIALEGSLDSETRENLARSHSASKSLIYVINDLLDLTKTEEGQELVRDDVFDLPATIKEATDMFVKDAQRKQITYNIHEYPGLPSSVVGDQRRVRQILSNLIANAIQNTSSGTINVEAWVASQQSVPGRVEVEFAVQDTGVGMSEAKVEALFRDLEQVSAEEEASLLSSALEENKSKKKPTLGLGLALVARFLRNMDGQLRVKSEEGKGSRFVIQLAFMLPDATKSPKVVENRPSSKDHMTAATPPATEGSVTLIERHSERAEPYPLSRQHSVESVKSARSQGSMKSFQSQSSGKSDVDRLIDAIQEPLLVSRGEHDPEQRRSSRGSASSRSSRGTLSRHYQPSTPGQESINDARQPLRALRIPDDHELSPRDEKPRRIGHNVSFSISNDINQEPSTQSRPNVLRILVAEDDPINSKILKKRLEKMGHHVYLTVNGEECAAAHGEHPSAFDVVLMDIQMPIVDGLTSTKMIRSFEKSNGSSSLSDRSARIGRIPIIAVSASLVEKELNFYKSIGFDGWMLKPIDFRRLSLLFDGIESDDERKGAVYHPGHWELGGWFNERSSDIYAANTKPAESVPPPPPEDENTPKTEVAEAEETSVAPVVEATDG